VVCANELRQAGGAQELNRTKVDFDLDEVQHLCGGNIGKLKRWRCGGC
jgi:hypothetical protein